MRKFLFFLICLVVSFQGFSQDCNCPQSLEWMISTFEKKDAGFEYVIDKKGKEEYDKHVASTKEKAKTALTIEDCRGVLFNWLRYFRPGHIGIVVKEEKKAAETTGPSDAEIRKRFEKEKKIKLT